MVSFSLLGVLALMVGLALFSPAGLGYRKGESSQLDSAYVATSTAAGQSSRLRGSDITWKHAPALTLTGIGAGFLSGMIGMGGGVLKMCFMLLFLQLDIFFARAISIVTMFFSSVAALRGFLKQRLVVWPYAVKMIAVAAPASFLAAMLGNVLHENTLTLAFGFFIVFLGFNIFAFILADPNEREMTADLRKPPSVRDGYFAGAIGLFHGAACGLLGISGGVIATPLQQLALRMPLRNSIANTLAVSCVVTLVGGACVVSNGISSGSFKLADVLFVDMFMGGGAILGAPIGNYLGARCNVTALRFLFVALTMGAGISILT